MWTSWRDQKDVSQEQWLYQTPSLASVSFPILCFPWTRVSLSRASASQPWLRARGFTWQVLVVGQLSPMVTSVLPGMGCQSARMRWVFRYLKVCFWKSVWFQVNRLICLCVTSLCNKFLPKSEIDNPEFEDPQAFIIIGLIVLIIVLISCASSKFLFKFCKKLTSNDKNSLVTKDCEKGGYGVDNVLYHVFQDYPPPPPSVKRMNSAPAAMTGGTKNTDIGVRFINVKASFPAKIKESLTSLEKLNVSKIKPKPITRIETEVWNL